MIHGEPALRTGDPHEHGWATESAHASSEGTVRSVRCTGCGARRVDVSPADTSPPVAASAVIPGPPRAGAMMEHVHARSRTSTPSMRTS
jgi:hypothetical protein